ncbi:MAG: acyltransferase family protein [Paracoccaceae bacterium]
MDKSIQRSFDPSVAAPAVAAARTATPHRRAVDLARFVAACGIVWDHAHAPFAAIGYTALALFLMLTAFLAMGSFERSNGKAFWFSRAKRIFLPWVFWSLVYRIVYIRISDDPGPLQLFTDPFTLLIGSSIHLWFLPFVMLALALIPVVSRTVTTPLALWVACAALLVISLPLAWIAIPIAWIVPSANLPEPFPQWAFSLPLFLYGALIAAGHKMHMAWLPVATAAVISALIYAFEPGFSSIQMILTALLFEAVWRSNLQGKWATTLAGYAFGIYVLHPFFVLVAYKLFGAEVNAMVAALFAIATAIAATALLRQTPFLRQFV